MNRIGHESNPKSVTNSIRSPSVTSPVETRHDPTARSTTMPRVGSISSAGSKPARMYPAWTRSSRSARASTARRSVSSASRPSVFTTSAPSMLSWATAETSPIFSWARRAGPCIRRAKLWFMSASAGNSRKPISARNGSVRRSAIMANTTRKITPHANGTGCSTSTAASTSASMCASSSPVGVSLWNCSDSSRYRSATRLRRVAITWAPATPL